METRRLLLFLVVSFGFVLIWTNFVAKKPPQPPAAQDVADTPQADADDTAEDSAEGDAGLAGDAAGDVAAGDDAASDDAAGDEVTAEAEGGDDGTVAAADPADTSDSSTALAQHERRSVTLGSSDPDGSYAIEAVLSTEGASVTSVRLADPRMKELKSRDQQVQVLGNNSTDEQTFSTSLDLIDRQLAEHSPGMSLETVDWGVRHEEQDAVTFAYVAPDRSLEVEKTYRVTPAASEGESDIVTARRENPVAYTIACELTVRNLSTEAQEVQYEILGPCGVILENEEHTRKYRDIKLEFVKDDGSAVYSASDVQSTWQEVRASHPRSTRQEVSELVSESDEKWIEAARYAGVDVQFFAALIAPVDDRPLQTQLDDRRIERIWPVLLREKQQSTLADITFRMRATPRTLTAKGTEGDVIRHDYALFVGPKHRALLDPPPFRAEKVLDYGTFFGFIARWMHTVLSFLFGIGMPYWLAIISLTVMVRCCLFPLSRKQAISAARMKELQPKIAELKVKYGDDKEKMAKAQMELWRKYNINPLGGCLPLFFQLPVFIGLYTCLNTAVDLRLSGFLWIDNLAAPDALFRMPVKLPFLGQDFNLLPCVNVLLFLVQQKLFMPPPTDEQQEIQQKMMNVMTIMFAVMFWHVPAGLCIYFVASSLWSIGERKLLGSDVLTKNVKLEEAEPPAGKRGQKKKAPAEAETSQPRGLMARLMDAAEQAKEQAEQNRRSGQKKKGKRR